MNHGDQHHTKRGPGRLAHRIVNPAGTKRIKRFIKDARGENVTYRLDLEVLKVIGQHARRAMRINGLPNTPETIRRLKAGMYKQIDSGQVQV